MLRALYLAVLWATPLAAQSERVALEWDRWLAAEGNPPGALVFTLAGTELLAQESGASVDVPLPLASNSKAITALCAAALVDAGKMHWNDTVGDWIEGGGSVTLSELVTHTSGYWPDSTQGLMADWRGDTTRRWQEVTANVLDRPKQEGTRGTFRYNNENYAVLGLVIEEVADDWYDAACRARVLDPLGITTADLSPDYGGFGPWGGWQMSVRDYAHFMNSAYAGADPLSTPHADMGDGVSYGLGMVFALAGGRQTTGISARCVLRMRGWARLRSTGPDATRLSRPIGPASTGRQWRRWTTRWCGPFSPIDQGRVISPRLDGTDLAPWPRRSPQKRPANKGRQADDLTTPDTCRWAGRGCGSVAVSRIFPAVHATSWRCRG